MKLKIIKEDKSILDAPLNSIIEVKDEDSKVFIEKGLCSIYTEEVAKVEFKEVKEVKEEALKKEIKEIKEVKMADNKEVAKEEGKIEVKEQKLDINKSMGTFLQDLVRNPSKLTLKASGMSEGVNADGGYLLTPQITSEIFGATIPGSVIYPKVFKIPVTSNSMKLPIFNNTGDSATTPPRMYPITPDGGSKTGTKPQLTQKTLSLVTWSYLVYATEELLEDAPAFGAWIIQKIKEKHGYDFDNLCLNGVAATNGMEGVLTAAANSYRAACTVAATIGKTSVINLIKGVMPQYQAGAEWYMGPNTWASAMDQLSTATSVNPSFGSVMSVDGTTLMNKPVNVMPQMANLASNGDILYGNFGTYAIIEKSAQNVAISRDFKFDTDEIAFRVTSRYAGATTIPSKTNTDTSIQAAFSARF